jgi:hypothetical protein
MRSLAQRAVRTRGARSRSRAYTFVWSQSIVRLDGFQTQSEHRGERARIRSDLLRTRAAHRRAVELLDSAGFSASALDTAPLQLARARLRGSLVLRFVTRLRGGALG